MYRLRSINDDTDNHGQDGVYRSHPYTTWMRTVPMTEQRKRERLLEELRRIDDRAESL